MARTAIELLEEIFLTNEWPKNFGESEIQELQSVYDTESPNQGFADQSKVISDSFARFTKRETEQYQRYLDALNLLPEQGDEERGRIKRGLISYISKNLEFSKFFYHRYKSLPNERDEMSPEKIEKRKREYLQYCSQNKKNIPRLTNHNLRNFSIRAALVSSFEETALPLNEEGRRAILTEMKPSVFEICSELIYGSKDDLARINNENNQDIFYRSISTMMYTGEGLADRKKNIMQYLSRLEGIDSTDAENPGKKFAGKAKEYMTNNVVTLEELIQKIEYDASIVRTSERSIDYDSDPILSLAKLPFDAVILRLDLDNLGFAQPFYDRLLAIQNHYERQNEMYSSSLPTDQKSIKELIDRIVAHLDLKQYTFATESEAVRINPTYTFTVPRVPKTEEWNALQGSTNNPIKTPVIKYYFEKNQKALQDLASEIKDLDIEAAQSDNRVLEQINQIQFQCLTQSSPDSINDIDLLLQACGLPPYYFLRDYAKDLHTILSQNPTFKALEDEFFPAEESDFKLTDSEKFLNDFRTYARFVSPADINRIDTEQFSDKQNQDMMSRLDEIVTRENSERLLLDRNLPKFVQLSNKLREDLLARKKAAHAKRHETAAARVEQELLSRPKVSPTTPIIGASTAAQDNRVTKFTENLNDFLPNSIAAYNGANGTLGTHIEKLKKSNFASKKVSALEKLQNSLYNNQSNAENTLKAIEAWEREENSGEKNLVVAGTHRHYVFENNKNTASIEIITQIKKDYIDAIAKKYSGVHLADFSAAIRERKDLTENICKTIVLLNQRIKSQEGGILKNMFPIKAKKKAELQEALSAVERCYRDLCNIEIRPDVLTTAAMSSIKSEITQALMKCQGVSNQKGKEENEGAGTANTAERLFRKGGKTERVLAEDIRCTN